MERLNEQTLFFLLKVYSQLHNWNCKIKGHQLESTHTMVVNGTSSHE